MAVMLLYLCLMSRLQAPAGKSTPARGSSAFPSPPLVAVHRVRWNRGANASGLNGGVADPENGGDSKKDATGNRKNDSDIAAGWLAHGGAAGLVCLQHLP